MRVLALSIIALSLLGCGGTPNGSDVDAAPLADAPDAQECAALSTSPITLATGAARMVSGGTALYYSDSATRTTLMRVDAGGAPVVVATGLPAGIPVAYDSGAVYWRVNQVAPYTLLRISVADGAVATLVTDGITDYSITAANGRAFWTGTNALFSIAAGEASPRMEAAIASATSNSRVRASGDFVYWTSGNSIFRYPVAGGLVQEVVLDVGDSDSRPYQIVADVTKVYWVGQRVLSECVFGCATATIIEDSRPGPEFRDLARVESGLVYAKDGGTGERVIHRPFGGIPVDLAFESGSSGYEVADLTSTPCGVAWIYNRELRAMAVR